MSFYIKIAIGGALYLSAWICTWYLATIAEVTEGTSIWYPPAALSFAAIVIWPRVGFALAFLGAFLTGQIFWPNNLQVNFITSTGHTGGYAIAAWLYRAATGPLYISARSKTILRFLAFSAIGAGIATAMGNFAHAFAASFQEIPKPIAVLSWWLGDYIGVITLAPALTFIIFPWINSVIGSDRPQKGWRWTWRNFNAMRLVEIGGLAGFAFLAKVLGDASGIDGAELGILSLGIGLCWLFEHRKPRDAFTVLALSSILVAIWIPASNDPTVTLQRAVVFLAVILASLFALARSDRLRRDHMRTFTLDRRASRLEANLARLREGEREARHALTRTQDKILELGHELRTPLNAVIGFSELIGQEAERRYGDKKLATYAQHTHESGLYLLGIINNILDGARLSRGHLELRTDRLDPTDIIESTVRMIEIRARNKGQTLHVEMDQSLEVLADETRLKQVVTNLISNAIKYTQHNGTVTVRVCDDPETNSVIIGVADNGPGIPAGQLNKVLMPFNRGAQDKQGLEEGTGLGLPYTIQMVHEMNGQIDFDSAEGEGTLVTVSLPKALPACPATPAQTAS